MTLQAVAMFLIEDRWRQLRVMQHSLAGLKQANAGRTS